MISWTLIVGCAVVLAMPLAWRIARRCFDPFEPIVLFAIAFGAMFVARPASMLTGSDTRFWGVDVLPTLPRTLMLALVGAVAFVTGYETHPGRRLARRLPRPRPIDTGVAAVAALGVAAVASVALVILLPTSEGFDSLRILLGGRSGELGELIRGSSDYFWYGSLLFAPAAFVLIALALRDRSLVIGAAASIVLLLAMGRVVPVGGRIVLLPLLGGVFVLVYVMRERRPGAPFLAALAAVALVGSYLILHVRDPTDDLTLQSAVEQLESRPHAVLDPVLHGADAEMVLALSAALTVIPEDLPHRWGSATVGNVLTRPIPRELWSGKPRTPGETVVVTVWPHLYPGLNPAFSPLLVLYWDFGLAGVAVGMALFGLLARAFYEWFRLYRDSFAAQLIFASGLWFVVIAARNDPVDMMVLGAFLIGPILAVVAIASEGVLPARFASRLRRPDASRSQAHGTGEAS